MHVGGIQYARLSKERFSSAGGASSMAGQMVYVCVRVFFVLCFFHTAYKCYDCNTVG